MSMTPHHPGFDAPGGPPVRNGKGGRTNKDNSDEDGFKLWQVVGGFRSLPRVLKLVWETKASYTIIMAIISLIRGFTPAATVWITKLVLDAVVAAVNQRGEVATVFWLVGLQLLINVISSLMDTLRNIVQQLLQDLCANRIQLMIMEKANTLDLSFFENSEFYDKMRQAQQQAGWRPVTMVNQAFELVKTLITFFSMIFLLLQLEWWLGVVALLVPIPAFIADSRYGWVGYQRSRRQSPERRQMEYYNYVTTTDTFNKEVKLFTLGGFFIDRYRTLAIKIYNENKGILIKRYMASFVWGAMSVAANAGIYLYVALQAVAARITVGDLLLFTQAAQNVGSNFQQILGGVSSMYQNQLFVGTLYDFLEYEPKIKSPELPEHIPAPANGVQGLSVEFRNVSFKYPGKRDYALQNVSFTIGAGEAIALVGRNGAGKTTLIKLLSRLYDPDDGEILVGGRNIKDYELTELREQVGVIFQDYATYYMSASDNIGVGRLSQIENKELVAAAATKSGADTVVAKLDNGYETMLGKWFKEGTQLSGGEWQKIALARAFMRDARVLILDEPTSSLDAQAEYEVFANFRTLTRGKTAVFISHRFSTVRLADRIFVIENGGILEEGTHSELMALDGRYAELFNLQAEAYR